MPGLFANFGAGMVAAKPVVRTAVNTWQECEQYVRNDTNTAWIKVWPSLAAALAAHTVQGYETSMANPSPPPALLWNPGSATYYIDAAGTARGVGTNGDSGTGTNTTYSGEWMLGGTGADYEVRATLVSGTSPSGSAVGSWLSCSSNRSWSLSYAGTGTSTTVITVEIREAVSGTVLATANITLQVTR